MLDGPTADITPGHNTLKKLSKIAPHFGEVAAGRIFCRAGLPRCVKPGCATYRIVTSWLVGWSPVGLLNCCMPCPILARAGMSKMLQTGVL